MRADPDVDGGGHQVVGSESIDRRQGRVANAGAYGSARRVLELALKFAWRKITKRHVETPHFAIVTDPLGTEIGFPTFEHIVEALFGPVEDEFSKTSPAW